MPLNDNVAERVDVIIHSTSCEERGTCGVQDATQHPLWLTNLVIRRKGDVKARVGASSPCRGASRGEHNTRREFGGKCGVCGALREPIALVFRIYQHRLDVTIPNTLSFGRCNPAAYRNNKQHCQTEQIFGNSLSHYFSFSIRRANILLFCNKKSCNDTLVIAAEFLFPKNPVRA